MARDRLSTWNAPDPEPLGRRESATDVRTSGGDFFDEVLAADSDSGHEQKRGSRPRRSRRRRTGCLVTLLVLVVVLAAGAVGAEYLVRGRIDSTVRSALPGLSSDARISTRGIVLTQLVSGSLNSLAVDSKTLEMTPNTQDGTSVTLSDVDVDLSGISLTSPYPTDTVTASGTVSWEQVAALAAKSHPNIQGVTLEAEQTGTSAQQPGTIRASASLLGISGEAQIVPSVKDDGSLVLTVTSTKMGGEQTGVDTAGDNPLLSYIGMDSPELTIPTDSLPQGLRLTGAVVTSEGLRLSLSGSEVSLGQL